MGQPRAQTLGTGTLNRIPSLLCQIHLCRKMLLLVMATKEQKLLFRGIYEFEDPAGTLLASKSPSSGSADLYDGTAIIVKPNQCAMLVYKGQIADVLTAGLHKITTQNFPVITRLANWKFGFRSPLTCEIWFFSGNSFTARKWGTPHPVLHNFKDVGLLPIRSFGNYNIAIKDPKKLYMTLIGSRQQFDLMDLEEFVQGQIQELLPQALDCVKDFKTLNRKQHDVAKRLQDLTRKSLKKYGILIEKVQILSLVPPKETLEAMGAKSAMGVLGDQRRYLLYKAANSLESIQGGGDSEGSDSMQMMMGLMLGKGLLNADAQEPVPVAARSNTKSQARGTTSGKSFCHNCGHKIAKTHKFCSNCGGRL